MMSRRKSHANCFFFFFVALWKFESSKNFTRKINVLNFNSYHFEKLWILSNRKLTRNWSFFFNVPTEKARRNKTSNRSQPRFSSDWMNVTKKLFFQCKKRSVGKKRLQQQNNCTMQMEWEKWGETDDGREELPAQSARWSWNFCDSFVCPRIVSKDDETLIWERKSCATPCDMRTVLNRKRCFHEIMFPLISLSFCASFFIYFCERSIFRQGNKAKFLCCLMLLHNLLLCQ